MNELIYKLFNQAWDEKGFEYIPTPTLERFAQLIVQECAEVAGCNGHISGFALGDLILQRFGVEPC